MPGSVDELIILLLAVLPGSAFTWAFERQASAFGVTLADRTLRLIGASVVFHVVLAWPEYAVYRLALDGHDRILTGQFAVAWLGLLLLAGLPAVTGTVLGGLYATRTERTGWQWIRQHMSRDVEARLLEVALGRTPAPRAWDNFFSERPSVYLRVRTTDDTWLGGRFASASYAAGFPNEPDLYLEEAWQVDQVTGEFVGDSGLGVPVYIPAGQVRWIEIVREQHGDESGAA